MTILLMLSMFSIFLVIDWFRTRERAPVWKGTQYTTPDFEALGAFAQDGGELIEKEKK